MFCCVLRILGYSPILSPGEKGRFYKLFYILLFLSRYSFDSFDSFEMFQILPFPEMFQILPFPEMFQILPFPEMFQILPFPEMFRISPIDRKSRDIPEKFQAVRFCSFSSGSRCSGLSLFVFVFLYFFVFCILYFVFLDNPSYSLEFFESFEFFDFHTFIFSFCLYISIYSRYFLHTIPWRDILFFLFCLHISNLSTI